MQVPNHVQEVLDLTGKTTTLKIQPLEECDVLTRLALDLLVTSDEDDVEGQVAEGPNHHEHHLVHGAPFRPFGRNWDLCERRGLGVNSEQLVHAVLLHLTQAVNYHGSDDGWVWHCGRVDLRCQRSACCVSPQTDETLPIARIPVPGVQSEEFLDLVKCLEARHGEPNDVLSRSQTLHTRFGIDVEDVLHLGDPSGCRCQVGLASPGRPVDEEVQEPFVFRQRARDESEGSPCQLPSGHLLHGICRGCLRSRHRRGWLRLVSHSDPSAGHLMRFRQDWSYP